MIGRTIAITANTEEVKKELKQAEKVITTLEGLGAEKELRDYVSDAGVMEIKTAGARSGQPYKESKPETILAKGKDTPLIDTGALLRDIINLRTNMDDANSQVLTVINTYASILQSGTRFMPSRKIFNFVQKDEQNMAKIIQDKANKNLNAIGKP